MEIYQFEWYIWNVEKIEREMDGEGEDLSEEWGEKHTSVEGIKEAWTARPHETLNFLLLSAGKLTTFIPGVGSSPGADFSFSSLFSSSHERRNFSLCTPPVTPTPLLTS